VTVTTIRPDATPSTDGWTIIGGAGSHHAAQSDNSDATGSRSPSTATSSLQLGLPVPTVGATQRVYAVRVRLRALRSAGTTSDLRTSINNPTTGVAGSSDRWTFVPTVATELVGAWRTTAPGGAAWTSALVGTCVIAERDFTTTAGSTTDVLESYADVDIRDQPVADVLGPTGTITNTSQPQITFNADNLIANSGLWGEVKVFTADVYSGAGFNPDTSPPAWQAGPQAGEFTWVFDGVEYSSGSIVPDLLLNGITYRAYVRVGTTWSDGQPWWSAWDFTEFDLDLVPPPQPTVEIGYDNAAGSPTVHVTGDYTGWSEVQYYVERSDDDGATWQAIQGGLVEPDASWEVVLIDWAAPRGQNVTYRVTASALQAGQRIAADPVSATYWNWNDRKWWFKVPAQPELSLGGVAVLAGLSLSVEETLGVFRPLGRERAVVVSGDIYGEDGTYQIKVNGAPQWASMRALLRYQGAVLVQDPFGEQKWVRVISRSWSLLGGASCPQRPIDVQYVEVDAPIATDPMAPPTGEVYRFTLGTGDERSTLGIARL
jgi:hypothetical protein